ncbi:MAG: DUF5778 family protein [Halodesulfurarchaeum sp.]
MSEDGDVELYEQAVSLLRPGEDRLVGVVVHTDIPQYAESGMNKLMREIGNRIASTLEAGETYIYAGEDDSRFGAGQFHGRRLVDDEVVWECQQLLRDGTFDLVFYWKDSGGHDAVVASLDDLEHETVPITEDGYGHE